MTSLVRCTSQNVCNSDNKLLQIYDYTALGKTHSQEVQESSQYSYCMISAQARAGPAEADSRKNSTSVSANNRL